MPYTPAASVQGLSLRVTRLDANGNLLNGPTDSYITTAFIRVSFTPEYEDGDEITEKAADGTVCVSFKAPDTLKRVNLEIAICDPNPELSALLSGGLLLSGPDANKGGEVTKGWASAQVGEDPSGNGVAVELWSNAIENGKPASTDRFFHWVFPFVKTRLSGDRVVENGLLATSFEGYGLGNINFRNGPDGSWAWPAAVDRPYLYARTNTAQQGNNGFFTYPDITNITADDPAKGVAAPSTFTNITGTNVPDAGNPYPYDSGQAYDPVLSSQDYSPDDSGTGTWEDSADAQNVANIPPAGTPADGTTVPATPGVGPVQNPVTYEDRGGASGAPVAPKTVTQDVNSITAGTPGQLEPRNATVPKDLTALRSANPPGGTGNWNTGEYIVLADGSHAYWGTVGAGGPAWHSGDAP